MDIQKLVELIRKDAYCKVLPAAGKPKIPKDLKLPVDVLQFYELCGGIYLYESNNYAIKIVEPNEFIRANPIIIGEEAEDDISFNWFIIAHNFSTQYITIDLSEERRGYCYDSFCEIHALMGSQPVIAKSFTQLLSELFKNKGQYWYWLKEDFNTLGDAYTPIKEGI